MLLTALTDEEFLRHAQAEHEPLIASGVEAELLKRFGALLDETAFADEVRAKLDEYGIEHDASHLDQYISVSPEFGARPIGELTDLLAEFDIDTLDALRKVLDRDAKVTQILADITQPINTLAEMANAQ